MKKILAVAIFLLLANIQSVFAEDEMRLEAVVGLPKTYAESDVHIMSNTQDEFNKRMQAGWDTLEADIDVSDLGITLSNYQEYYEVAKHSSPLYYYVDNSYHISYYDDGTVAEIHPKYTETDLSNVKKTVSDIEAEGDKIMLSIDDCMTDFQKVMAVHDYMVLNYSYDTSLANHTITIMTTKTGVCESYTYAFMYMMDRLGIEAKYVSSDAMNHAWNLVKLDGEWYHLDITWDDPVPDQIAQVRHTYALLSSEAIENMDTPHTGFDLAGLTADSGKFNTVAWHDSLTSIVSIYGQSYWTEGNKLVRDDGTIINDSLSEDNRWQIGDGYLLHGAYPGLAAYNDKLYFSSDTKIFLYNPEDGKTEVLQKNTGICGMYLDGNDLKYCKFSRENNVLYDAGKIHLGDIRIGGMQVIGDKLVIRILCENDSGKVISYAAGENGCQMMEAKENGLSKISFDVEENLAVFFWNSGMKPLREKEEIVIQ